MKFVYVYILCVCGGGGGKGWTHISDFFLTFFDHRMIKKKSMELFSSTVSSGFCFPPLTASSGDTGTLFACSHSPARLLPGELLSKTPIILCTFLLLRLFSSLSNIISDAQKKPEENPTADRLQCS